MFIYIHIISYLYFNNKKKEMEKKINGCSGRKYKMREHTLDIPACNFEQDKEIKYRQI